MYRFFLLSVCLICFVSFSAAATESLSYSGRLVNANGAPVTGPVHLKFDLAYTNNLSTILCTHDNPGVDLINGVFHAKLEFNCPSSSLKKVLEEIPSNNSIAIRVTDLTPATPKVYSFQALNSVPYAIMSNFAKQLLQMDATTGQVLTWNGVEWAAADPVGSADGVTTIVAQEGLSGVKVNETVTIGIADGGVTAQKLHQMGATTAGQVLKWNGTSWAPGADLDTDNVRAFARNDVSGITPPSCSADQTLQYALLTDSLVCADIVLSNADIQSAAVADAINDGETAKAPSQNAVFDALSGKQNTVDSSSDITMKSLKLMTDGSTWMGLKSPTSAGNLFFTLPGSWGTNGQVLHTDGAGNLTWTTPSTTSADIVDGSIVDADIASGANIAQSKIAGLGTSLTNLDNRITNLNTDDVPEGTTNFYFTEAKVLATDLAGLNTTAGAVTAADSLLSSIGKIVGNVAAVSAAQGSYVLKDGTSVMTGDLNLGTKKIINLADPAADQDAATKKYVDDLTALSASQWTKTSSDIHYDLGSVGIGTTSPSYTLDVHSADSFQARLLHSSDSQYDGSALMMTRTRGSLAAPMAVTSGDTLGGLYFRSHDGSGTGTTNSAIEVSAGEDHSGTNRGTYLIFETTTNGSASRSEKMRIHSNGNIGIGTNIPANKLDVVGSIGLTGQLRLKSDNANHVELKAPLALASIQTYTFPATTGTSGYALTTNGTGVLSWSEVATTASTVGGDLTGTIADAQIAANAVGTNELANSSVTYPKLNLTDGDVPQAKVNGLVTALSGKEPTITAGTTSQYWRGDKTWQTLNTTIVPEGTNLYFLDSRVRGALLSGYAAGSATPLAATDTLLEALAKLEGQIIANKAAFDSSGQWSKNGTSVYYNGGNVGVGTDTPTKKFDVRGEVQFGINSPTSSNLIFSPSGVAQGTIRFTSDASANYIQSGVDGTTDSTKDLRFGLMGTSAHWMVIKGGTGNVGIGTSSPERSLDAVGDIRAYKNEGYNVIESRTASEANLPPHFILRRSRGTVQTPTYVQTGDTMGLLTFRNHSASQGATVVSYATENQSAGSLGANLAFFTIANGGAVNSERMRIDQSGNVGIGTSAPGQRLHVTQDQTTQANDTPMVYMSTTGTATDNKGAILWLNSTRSEGNDNTDLFKVSNNVGTKFTVRNTGKVGVGTALPEALVQMHTTHGGTIGGSSANLASAALVISNLDNQKIAFDGNEIRQFGTGNLVLSGETGVDIKVGDQADGTEVSGIKVTAAGYVGIGTLTPSNKLHVVGSIGATGWVGAGCEGACSTDAYAISYANGDIKTYDGTSSCTKTGGSATFSCSSDERLKNTINPFLDGLDHILKLQPKTYYWNNDEKRELNFGFIAQEVQKVIPHAVTEQERPGGKFLSLDQGTFIPYMVNAIKDLNFKIEENIKVYQIMHEGILQDHERRLVTLEEENEKIKTENKVMKEFLCEKYPEAGFCK